MSLGKTGRLAAAFLISGSIGAAADDKTVPTTAAKGDLAFPTVHTDASRSFEFTALGMEGGRRICANVSNTNTDPRTYVYGCMSFYLGFMDGQPAQLRKPFAAELQALETAQRALEGGALGYPQYFGIVREKTLAISCRFQDMPLLDWAMGEVVVGISDVVQRQATGDTNARYSAPGEHSFKCALTVS